MNYQMVLWMIFCLLLICFAAVNRKQNKKVNTILFFLMLVIILGQMLLPRQLFGKWNAIPALDGKDIIQILLKPSEPGWEVNLVGKDFIIDKKSQVDTIISLLKKAEIYMPAHPTRIWETKMILIRDDKDSIEIVLNKTANSGLIVSTRTNDWRKDEIGNYLETITAYRQPVCGDTWINKKSHVVFH